MNFPIGAVPLSFAYFGPGTGPILLDNVGCTGSEARVWDCPNLGVGTHNCGHPGDASVRCQSKFIRILQGQKLMHSYDVYILRES